MSQLNFVAYSSETPARPEQAWCVFMFVNGNMIPMPALAGSEADALEKAKAFLRRERGPRPDDVYIDGPYVGVPGDPEKAAEKPRAGAALTSKDMVWVIHPQTEDCRRVAEDEAQKLLKNGYLRGRTLSGAQNAFHKAPTAVLTDPTPKVAAKAPTPKAAPSEAAVAASKATSTAGKIWINNPKTKERKRVDPNELKAFQKQGFERGRG